MREPVYWERPAGCDSGMTAGMEFDKQPTRLTLL